MNYRHTAAAFALTLIAVAVPCVAWFFVGVTQLERELDLQKRDIYSKAEKKGVVHTERLATRFEVLRETESGRPFYHYQNLFHDPEGAAEGASVTVSPLAKGSPDPLIEGHFQVDMDGRLTLPTVNDDFPELGLKSTDGAACALLEELKDVAYFCFGELDLAPGVVAELTRDGQLHDEEDREITLSARAWRQNLEANALYADIKYAKKSGALGHTKNGDTPVKIRIEPLRWYTLPVGDGPGLVALRQVETPVGVWTQGFLVSPEAVAEHLAHSHYPATFGPLTTLGDEDKDGQVVYRITGTSWAVGFDISETVDDAIVDAGGDRDRFFTFFTLGAVSAALAGLLVVAMVFQSERLASQRAQFAASAAHELRTPLAGLRLYGEMLAEGLGNPKRARDYARRMAAEAERLGRVVTNVLSFTRLERKSLSVHAEPGDLGDAVQVALERQRPALEEAGAAVELHLGADLPRVRFDRDAVAHIVQNLVDNAEKYTRGLPDRKIDIHLERARLDSGEGVELSVSDNGQGISREVRRRLFRPFARGEVHDAEGLGLGLVLVKALATAQGGDIRYRDRPGGGAEFTVTFAA